VIRHFLLLFPKLPEMEFIFPWLFRSWLKGNIKPDTRPLSNHCLSLRILDIQEHTCKIKHPPSGQLLLRYSRTIFSRSRAIFSVSSSISFAFWVRYSRNFDFSSIVILISFSLIFNNGGPFCKIHLAFFPGFLCFFFCLETVDNNIIFHFLPPFFRISCR